MNELSITQLADKLFPKSRVTEFAPYWKECFEFAQINTPDRIAMFLAQVGHESAGFTAFEENLNYTAVRLAQVWPGRFARKDDKGKLMRSSGQYVANDLAVSLHRKPEAIANVVYANRYGNGSTASGDGWRYRGRGPKQLTFKSNYRECTRALWPLLSKDFVEEPDLLLEPKYGLWAAVWFWKINRLNRHADARNVTSATKVINGGTNGLDDRNKRFLSAINWIETVHPAGMT